MMNLAKLLREIHQGSSKSDDQHQKVQ